MEKVKLGRNISIIPSPVVLVGTMVEGRPEVHMMNPLLLTMPDNRYWLVGIMQEMPGAQAKA